MKPSSQVMKAWAYKYLGMWSASGNPDVAVSWNINNENKKMKVACGETLLIESDGNAEILK